MIMGLLFFSCIITFKMRFLYVSWYLWYICIGCTRCGLWRHILLHSPSKGNEAKCDVINLCGWWDQRGWDDFFVFDSFDMWGVLLRMHRYWNFNWKQYTWYIKWKKSDHFIHWQMPVPMQHMLFIRPPYFYIGAS